MSFPYTKVGPFTNSSTTPPVSAQLINGLEDAVYQATNEVWTTYAAGSATDITNLGGGASTSQWRWRYVAGLVQVQGFVALGTGGGCFGSVSLSLPVAANAQWWIPPSRVALIDSGTTVYDGLVLLSSNAAVVQAFATDGPYSKAVPLSSTAPFTWASGDELLVDFTYVPA